MMSPFLAALCALGLLVAAVAVGLWWRSRQGRVRRPEGLTVSASDLSEGALGAAGGFVLFRTEFCSRCPQVRRVLADITARESALGTAEIDLTTKSELARRFHILQTPTTFLVDARGTVLLRLDGVPTRAGVEDALHVFSPSSPAQEQR